MKKLLATTALVIAATSGAASAQSVLERVLDSINVGNTNMLPVTGTFANIAENIAVLGGASQYVNEATGETITASLYEAGLAAAVDALDVGLVKQVPAGTTYFYDTDGDGVVDAGELTGFTSADLAYNAAVTAAENTYAAGYTQLAGASGILNSIDGSITNTMNGISEATANVGTDVYAFEEVTVDIGDLSTTVLGAVNTGDITLGVNQDVSEAISGTSSAVSASINQLGGVTDQTALVLNVASNATDVIGSVNNSFTSLNGSIGNVATTVLGAVNTGTITSGINAAVTGVQSGIVGTN